jgi:hypothetical protein
MFGLSVLKKVADRFSPATADSLRRVLGGRIYRKARMIALPRGKELGIDWKVYCSLRRITPIRPEFGWRDGQPIDRYYTEELFLPQYAHEIRGHVLELADPRYTRRFGRDRVVKSDVLHLRPGNPEATIVADLTRGDDLPSDTFDCVILTFALQYVKDLQRAIETIHRILRPGGVMLATLPGISQISRWDMEHAGDRWRFTTLSARELFSAVFDDDHLTVQAYGNVLTAVASLHGIVAHELNTEELNFQDRDYEVVISVRAVKSGIVSCTIEGVVNRAPVTN